MPVLAGIDYAEAGDGPGSYGAGATSPAEETEIIARFRSLLR